MNAINGALTALIDDAIRRHGKTKGWFAQAIGKTPSQLSRLLHGQAACDTLTCFRIAWVAGVEPAAVLAAAGHVDLAALLERLYGRVMPSSHVMTPEEESDLQRLRALSPENRQAFRVLIEATAAQEMRARRRPK